MRDTGGYSGQRFDAGMQGQTGQPATDGFNDDFNTSGPPPVRHGLTGGGTYAYGDNTTNTGYGTSGLPAGGKYQPGDETTSRQGATMEQKIKGTLH
jgi:hypothetical protein